jgi:hypothetical protein
MTENKLPSFWSKPEGKTGMLFLAAMLAGGGYALYHFLPFLIKLLENTIYAGFLGAAVFVLSSPIWSSKVRAITSYAFRSFARFVTGMVVEIDPVGILKNYIEDIRENLADFDKQIGLLRGQITRVSTDIETNEREREQALKRASAAKQLNRHGDVQVETRQAGRLQKSNETLKVLLMKMNGIHTALDKLRQVSDITIRDMENDVRAKEKERKAILASHKALTSAIKIMNGDPDKRALYDQAMDYMAEDYANKVGELENFMEMSKGFIASIELDQLVLDNEGAEALAKFEAFEKQVAGFSLDGHPNQATATVGVPVEQDHLQQLYRRK